MRIAVVGLGYWGSKVFEEYCSLRGEGVIDSVSAIDADPKALNNVEQANQKFTSIESSFDEVDAYHVATSNASHYPIAKKGLENGKDILLEKPLTTDRDKAFDLIQIASENGCILQTGHIFRFADVVREVRELYQQGYLGELQHLLLRWNHDFQPEGEVDVAWDLIPHPIDIINFVTSDWPHHFNGVANSDPETGQRMAAHITFSLGEAKGVIQVSWVDKDRKRLLEIAGTKRSARVHCVDQEIILTNGNEEEHISIESNNTIRTEAKNFINASETGKNTFNSAIVGARTVDIIEQITGCIINE